MAATGSCNRFRYSRAASNPVMGAVFTEMCLTERGLPRPLETNRGNFPLRQLDHFVDLSRNSAGSVLAIVIENHHRRPMSRLHRDARDSVDAGSGHNGKSKALQH